MKILIHILPIFLLGCVRSAPKPNQQQEVVSPNGQYKVVMNIENWTDPTLPATPVWKVTIQDTNGTILYKDKDSKFIATLNVYWGWDTSNRLWLYNSDDGRIWRWELNKGQWLKLEGEGDYSIPIEILPDYAKSRRKNNTPVQTSQ